MPLLRKQPFHRLKPPPDLHPDDEVFHCSLTNEIFKTYEEFFERTILCNSLVWSCALTGRSGLTFAEALESERLAEKRLSTFDITLQRPLLFLVTLTQRVRIADLNDDIFLYAKDRYFIGETVEVVIGKERMTAEIIRVVAPARAVPSPTNGEVIVIDEDSEPEDGEREPPSPNEMMYVVSPSSGNNKRIMVKAVQISRKKGLYTRDRNKLFLKNKCHCISGMWRVQEAVMSSMRLREAKFEDFFVGPRPKFTLSEIKKRTYTSTSYTPNHLPTTSAGSAGSSRPSPVTSKGSTPTGATPSPQGAMSAAQIQNLRQQERLEKLAKQLAMKKKFEEERQRMKEEKERAREEKEKERLKKLEERRKEIERQKEWSRPREDMECDDLKPLPEFKELKTKIPTHLFGDALMVLEYVNAFKSLFDFDQFFPKGFSWDQLELALTEADQQGPLCDLFQMLLCTIFNLQEAEAGEIQAQDAAGVLEECEKKLTAGDDDNGEEDDRISDNELIRTATLAAQFPQLTFGMPLKDSLLDQFTLTEIMRLHLTSSGAHATQSNARFRYQQRGGYSAFDDPGFELRKQEPALMKKLQAGNVFDLSPDQKLRLLTTLVQQVMTYAAVRDIVEDSWDKLRLRKYDLKVLQWAEVRRMRECMALKYRRDMEERVKDQEFHLKTMTRAAQTKQALDNGLEPPTFPPLEDPRLTLEQKQQREEQELEEEKQNKEEFARKDLEAQHQIMELQQTNAIYPLGRDRLYRRYWFFSSLPAVLVEDHELFVPSNSHLPCVASEDADMPTVKPAEAASVSSEGEVHMNGATAQEGIPVVSGDRNNGNHSVNNSDVCDTNQNDRLKEPEPKEKVVAEKADIVMENGDPSVSSEKKVVSEKADTVTENGDLNGSSESKAKLDSSKITENLPSTKPVQLSKSSPDSSACEQSEKRAKWYIIDSKERLQQIRASLNPRGFRESALNAVLQDYQRLLNATIESCPVDKLCVSDTSDNKDQLGKGSAHVSSGSQKVKGSTKGDSASQIIELTLRDGLLDLEERIFVGCLGTLNVKDRAAWRASLENGGYSPLTDEAPFAQVHGPKKTKDRKGTSNKHIPEEVVAKDLAHALVQIARGVEPRFLKPPYGEAERRSLNSKEEKPEPQRRTIYDRWEDSALGATSLSQVFLHLAAMEKSIKWDRSTLKLRCRICRRMRDGDKMLLCDKCDRGHHMYCLKPPLTKVPAGDWFCHTCRPKGRAPAPRRQRKNFDAEEEEVEESMELENSLEDASDEGEDQEMEEDASDNENCTDDDIPNEDVCAECHGDGELILCDKCPRSYHLDCAQPPLKKVPKGKWLCQVCVNKGRSGKNKSKSSAKKGKSSINKGSPSVFNSSKSKHPNSRQQTPGNSPTPTSSRKRQEITPKGQSQKSKSTPKSLDSKSKQSTFKSSKGSGATPKGGSSGKSKQKRKYASTSHLPDADDGESSSQQSSISSSTQEQMQAAEDLLTDLMDHEEAWPFLEPVDRKVVPDYYIVIENPMDLSTIRSKLDSGVYSSHGQVLDDVRLIFANCIEYNLSSAPVYQSARVLDQFFQSRILELGLEPEGKSSSSFSPPAAKKQRR